MVLTLTAARPERTTLSGTMSLKKRRPSVAFSWHKPFAILAPWKKGKGDALLDSEVVLTKMKVLNNFEKLLSLDDSVSTLSLSVSEHGMPELSKAAEVSSVKSAPTGQESKDDYLSAMFSDPQLPRLYKFESEDSGVEMPSGATSPSTPSGSEQSFVVHSRESSCDSRALPSQDPLLLLGDECAEMLEMSDVHQLDETVIAGALETDLTEVDGLAEGEDTEGQFEQETSDSDLERPEDGSLRNPSELCEGESEQQRERGSERPAGEDDTRSRTECPDQACDDAATEAEFKGAALRKSTTSDSLDEYMEECCRLSEQVSQSRASPLGSGLGYLEHICQLIEKIGQLQEHNLKLQRQICGLQRDARVIKTKEDFFMQHCNCGAASLAFQEVKRHSRSDFPSGTLSDLTTIPEVTHNPLRGVRRDGDSVILPNIPLWRRGLNRRSYTEGEARYLGDSAEVLSAPHRRLSENYTWGKVKELVKKTKLRNQNRLGLSSTSLKNSCPQLYRPDLGPLDLPRRDRNSMIALGHQNKMDFLWAQ
ncbi:hypothetical protein AALO_G00229350 [Alosa alosa]|uniref:DUF4657 domain-containing protein n=1 Tax=Alosa alosa TaxID=278164 RepID=A0AAV6G0Y1_9TELE|nr:uncharacterized protein si:ch211-250c4.3 isoform X1 [Alosa alosa]KAG5266291.1 hypothetical protein AALO_G00229350 [Alosa alosa]